MPNDLGFYNYSRVTLKSSEASDLAVVNAARVSYDKQKDVMDESDEKLISYLIRNKHSSPFEHTMFKFLIECPIFVAREHHRHRIGHSYNEVSGRYVELSPEFFVPHPNNVRNRVGKPGHYQYEAATGPKVWEFIDSVMETSKACWDSYKKALEAGIAPEQARIVLPVNLMTKFYWTCNARSLMHYISLRGAPNAMEEIRLISNNAEIYLNEQMPITYQAFVANGKQAP